MAAIATALLGPALKRSGPRLLWRCPFHDDHDPSLQVDPAERRWKCWPCDLGGDAPALVMKLEGVPFPEAVRIVAELVGIVALSRPTARPSRPSARSGTARPSMPTDRPPVRAAERPPGGPRGLDPQEAERVVADASERIWSLEGTAALKYLLETRGLSEATVRAARLGWAKIRMPNRDGSGTWPLVGIVIPWLDSGRLTRIKVRRLGFVRGARYIEAFADRWRVYPGPEAIRPGMPLAIVEGELDAALLGQELDGLASVITLGSASTRPDSSLWLPIAACSQVYVALDGDPSGDDAAAEWGGRAVRVRPPIEPPAGKDWGDARKAGIDLRRWWLEDVLADAFDREERAGIFEFDAGMTREAADSAAGLRPARGGGA
jgi:DNA primase